MTNKQRFYDGLVKQAQELALDVSRKEDPSYFDQYVERQSNLRANYIFNYISMSRQQRQDGALLLDEVQQLIRDRVDIFRVRDMRDALKCSASNKGGIE